MQYAHEYPALALRTEGNYTYLKSIWRHGQVCEWIPFDGEPGFTPTQLASMRYQHAVTGINTECSELLQLFVADYLGNLEEPLDKLEVLKELGDIMWYVNLAFQALFTFSIPTMPRFPVSQAGVIRFSDYVNRSREMADGLEQVCVPVTMMELAVSAQHAGNLLLKWVKNTLYYGQVRDKGDIETQLCLIIAQVGKMAKMLGSDICAVLAINVDKLQKRFPEGFNGVDAVAQKDEAPGYKSLSDAPVWPTEHECTAACHDDTPDHLKAPADRQGLIIDGTFDQSTLTEPGATDKSDVAVLEQMDAVERFSRHLDQAAAIVATWPEWKRNLLGGAINSCVTQIDSLVEEIKPTAIPLASPQADLESRVRALSEQDIMLLETSVKFIRGLHEHQGVVTNQDELVSHFTRIVKGLGWGPTDKSASLPAQPLS